MKWIFLSLFVANIAYFVYQSQKVTADRTPVVYKNASTADGVQLLSERNQQSAREQEAQEVLQNPVQSTLRSSSPVSALVKAAPETPPESGPNSETAAVEGEVVAGQPTEGTHNVAAAQALQPAEAASSSDPAACWRLGAFTDLTIAQNAAERVNAMGTEARIRAIDAPTGDFDYRVVIPPMNSMQEAFRRLRELKNRNIDSYVMAQGENAQGISLGLFSTEEAAKRHQKDMNAMGYEAVIKPIARVSRAYWIYTTGGTFPPVILDAVQSADQALNASESDCLN